MTDDFTYDVFFCYSAKDEPTALPIAERLRADGLRVWTPKWNVRPGESFNARVEDGLEKSRTLVFCMSATAFGTSWHRMEACTFRFRDPLNTQRGFVALRLDRAPVKPSLSQYPHIDLCAGNWEAGYERLRTACSPRTRRTPPVPTIHRADRKGLPLRERAPVRAYSFSSDASSVVVAIDRTAQIWQLSDWDCIRVLKGHEEQVNCLAWSRRRGHVLTGSMDHSVRFWDAVTGSCLQVLKGHRSNIWSVALSHDDRYALSGSTDRTVRMWDLESGECLKILEGHTGDVDSIVWGTNPARAISGGNRDRTIRLWDLDHGRCLRVLKGHTNWIRTVAWSRDQKRVLSGANDKTVRLWDLDAGRCLWVLEGHTGKVRTVAFHPELDYALSAAEDNMVRVWDLQSGQCLYDIGVSEGELRAAAWSGDGHLIITGNTNGVIQTWTFGPSAAESTRGPEAHQAAETRYTNAKVLLVGESGVGKTGLSKVLTGQPWEPSDSTVGAWATHWKLPTATDVGVEREIWLWDFGGQADQRLIHRLYMEDAAVAVHVFDGQKDTLFETLGQWDRDLGRTARGAVAKLLVCGRVDAGGIRVSRGQLDAFAHQRGYLQLLETSSKTGLGCQELKQAILSAIRWDTIPWRSSPPLFRRLKEEILRLKDEGRTLMRFNELRETLQLQLSAEDQRFTDEELKSVVTLLSGPGVVWELSFGSWILLQPERINSYAQAVIGTLRQDTQELGCISEERVLSGDLIYTSSLPRLNRDDEQFVLLSMHKTLLEHGVCLRQHTESGTLLVFPSYYRRERPDLSGHPAVHMSFQFDGFLDDIYATLVVRLHHVGRYAQSELWRYAADFSTVRGKRLGVKLKRHGEGSGEIEVYFDPTISLEEKMIFCKYVHEHLLHIAENVRRLRHYVCPHCNAPIADRDHARNTMEGWMNHNGTRRPDGTRATTDRPTILCVRCEKRVLLWDEMEELFANPETKTKVHELDERSTIVLDNLDKERVQVGDVMSCVHLAGQTAREVVVADRGIDMEIEFRGDDGKPTGQKVYLQLKSGDSYLRTRKSDGVTLFRIRHERHARYWMQQAYPVWLVVRNSTGEMQWMEVGMYLRARYGAGGNVPKEIEFTGERFDVMSVRRLRERILNPGQQ